jgi:hypothetical protein
LYIKKIFKDKDFIIKKMLLEEITNKKQRDAVEKHNLDISQFNSKEDLSKHLLDISKKKYYEKNKEKFKEYYKQNSDVIKERQKKKRQEKKVDKLPIEIQV